MAERLSAMTDGETRLDIVMGAALRVLLLAGLCFGSVFYLTRFLGDARRLVSTRTL